MRVAVVIGNPKPRSRTAAVARSVAGWLCEHRDAQRSAEIDLADHASVIFDDTDEELNELAHQVADSDVVIVASPTYKGTYTGLLKGFLDRYPTEGLTGVTALPVMTAGSPHHSMSIDFGLRPLLLELGASVPTRGLYFQMSQFPTVDTVVANWAATMLDRPGWFGATVRGGDAA
jgi:FMN reductase